MLINLDNEEEGYLLVSCAGGIRSKGTLSVDFEEIKDEEILTIQVSGLKGGHSGMDIIKERGNSNKLIGRVLKSLIEEFDFNIVSI